MDGAITRIECNLCGADDAEILFEAGVAQLNRIVGCRRCGLMYSSPRLRPADQEFVKDYDPEVAATLADSSPDRFKKESLQVRDYSDTRKHLGGLYPKRGTLVELGCGMGFLLRAFADDGWEVTGIEPDRSYCRFIQSEHELTALPTILEDSGIADNSVNVAVILHVIEHVPDPLATLRAIFRVLKPGGHLVMETPRYDSLMFKLLRNRERSLSCDGHIYFFTTQTLREMYEKAGFEHRKLDYVGRSLSIGRLAWNLGVMSKSKPVQNGLSKLTDLLRLDSAHIHLNVRDMQRIVAQKPGGHAK